MHKQFRLRHPRRSALRALLTFGFGCTAAASLATQAYRPITPTMSAETVTLNGHDLTIEQVVRIARYGARVALSADARQRETDNYGLLLEAAAEGVPVYWFNRGTGDQRETVLFAGDAMSAENRPRVERTQADSFRRGALAGFGPEVAEEEIVRAMMVVRANSISYNAPSPPGQSDAPRPS